MKRLQVAPMAATRDYVADFPDDVARLVAVAAQAGYDVSPEVAARLWALYSEALCASWFSMASCNDESVLICLLKHAVITETSAGVPMVPVGYQTWLDYAVDTMTLPASEVRTLTDDELAAATVALRDATRSELGMLRQLAG